MVGHTEELGQSPISKTLNQVEQLADGRVRLPTLLCIFKMWSGELWAIANRAPIEKVRCFLFPVIQLACATAGFGGVGIPAQ